MTGAKSQTEGCAPANRGHFVATTGATTQTKCAAGSFQPEPGKDSCVPASIGSYVPVEGATYQIGCPSATEPGAIVCPAGDAAGGAVNVGDPCPPGSWHETGRVPDEFGCTPASPGTFVAGSGATSEKPCRAGTFSSTFGATECQPAAAGFFVPAAGASVELPCPNARVAGASRCASSVALTVAGAVLSRYRVPLYLTGGLLVVGGILLLLQQQGLLTRGSSRPAFAGGAWGGFDVDEDLQLVVTRPDIASSPAGDDV